jgi:hypothetical protein
MEFTPDSAKRFLLAKIDDQALRDHLPLNEAEKRAFLFSEAEGDSVDELDQDYVDGVYEKKISKLLRRSYMREKRTPEGKREWKAALQALSDEDFYGLVMVDQAGIPRTRGALRRFVLEQLPFWIVELAIIVLGFLVVFRPAVLGLSLPDWARLLSYPLFVWLLWYIGRIFGRMQTDKAIKRAESARR